MTTYILFLIINIVLIITGFNYVSGINMVKGEKDVDTFPSEDFVFNLALIIFVISSWIGILQLILIFTVLTVKGYKKGSLDITGLKEIKSFRLRFNFLKMNKIIKLYHSTDEETKELGLDILYKYMNWKR